MADPSVTYSFSNGEVASAPNVNQNFTDILAGIKSNSTSDLGCGSIKINGVLFASAAVSAVQSASVNQFTVVNTFTAGTVMATSATIGGVGIADYIEALLSMATGTFTATVSGCSTTSNDLVIRYKKIKDTVTLYIPEFQGTSDGTAYFDFSGLPSDIQPTPTSHNQHLTVNPARFYPGASLPSFHVSPYIPNSFVSCVRVLNLFGFADTGTLGWVGDWTVVYSV